ncbi:MAG: aromatic ring-hydroxylating dioxygenase subunit alpha [Pseudomonadota bacterium]
MLERQKHRLRATLQSDYTDPEVFTAEQAELFDKGWVTIGRSGCVSEPGDYVTARLGLRPIAVVRQKDGSLKAFANFCLHRYARLLDGTGNANSIVCPYHAWTYSTAGQLVGVPDGQGFCNVETKSLYLEELACEEYLGFIFVARDKTLAPVSERLAPLAALVEPYGLDGWQDRHVVHEEEWDGNWKFVIENFIESYHTTYAHKGSIGPTNPTRLAEQGPTGHEFFSIHSNSYRPKDLPPMHNPRLTAEDRNKFHVIGLYPNGLAAIDANFMWWMALEPKAANKTNARWGLSFAPETMAGEADPQAFIADVTKIIEIATEEDKDMVERAQDGANFASAEPGYLHDWLEVYVHEFQAYVTEAVSGARAA